MGNLASSLEALHANWIFAEDACSYIADVKSWEYEEPLGDKVVNPVAESRREIRIKSRKVPIGYPISDPIGWVF